MCGVVGIVSNEPVNQAIYNALTVMQHRGQDAAGIVTWSEEKGLKNRKGNGLVRDVFHNRHMRDMDGTSGIGHIRYPTAGSSNSSEAQPFYVNSPYGICLAHNGNLTNYEELSELLICDDRRHLSTNSDSEVLLNVLAHELHIRVNGNLTTQNVFDAVEALHERCKGGYSVVALIIGFGVVAFRDPNGIRPLVLGERKKSANNDYMVASESVALDVLQFSRLRDVEPGECVVIKNDMSLHCHISSNQATHTPCIFEYVYFARPDSILDGSSVYKARLRMGEQLAGKIVRDFEDHDIDVVIPIPDTSRTAALQVAYHLGVKYREGFIKNRYIGRTFIMPGQEERKKSVRQKLNAISLEFQNKNVLLVDDSIVRGTTSKQIIKLAREAGANKVYFASAAPPVRYPNVYGIDMPAASELIANGRSVEEIQNIIGADKLIYQDLSGLIRSVKHGNLKIEDFDTSCFSGRYVTGDVTKKYLDKLERRRNDAAKQKSVNNSDKDSNVIAL